MLGRVRIGAAGQPDVVGVVGARGPHLLTVHDELVAVTDRGGSQRREVGAGIGFGVADGEMNVAREDSGEELLLLLLGAVDLERRAHGLQGDQRQRDVRPVRLVDEDLLFDRPEPQPAVLLGPADPELAVRAHPLDHRAVSLVVPVRLHRLGLFGRDESREVLPQFGLQLPLLGCQFDVHLILPSLRSPHHASTRSRRCVGPPSSRDRSLIDE